MSTYSLTLSRVTTQVLFLILYPIFSCILLMGCIIMFGDYFNDDKLVWGVIISYIILLIASSIFILRRYILIPVKLLVEPEQLTVTLARRNMFYQFNKIVCGWNNVKNVSVNFDKNTKRKYLVIKLDEPGGNYIIAAKKEKDDATVDALWNVINTHINTYNKTQPVATRITYRDNFAGPWFKLLAYTGVCLIIAFGLLLIFSPDFRTTPNILKVAALCAFLIPFLFNFFRGNNKNNNTADL